MNEYNDPEEIILNLRASHANGFVYFNDRELLKMYKIFNELKPQCSFIRFAEIIKSLK